MTYKTSELTGAALDFAVAECEESTDQRITVIRRENFVGRPIERETEPGSCVWEWWAPSRIWAQGGLIIERERLLIQPEIGKEGSGNAWYCVSMQNTDAYGPTALIAAMRCYVASKLGDTFEVPDSIV